MCSAPGLYEVSAVCIPGSQEWGWAEVIVAPWLSGVAHCRICKPEGRKEIPKKKYLISNSICEFQWMCLVLHQFEISFLMGTFILQNTDYDIFLLVPVALFPWAVASLFWWPESSSMGMEYHHFCSELGWTYVSLSPGWHQDHQTTAGWWGDRLQLAASAMQKQTRSVSVREQGLHHDETTDTAR